MSDEGKQDSKSSDLPDLPPIQPPAESAPQASQPTEQPQAPEPDPDNPIARRRRELAEQKAAQAARDEQVQAGGGEDSPEESEEEAPDPELIPSVLQAFIFPFKGSAALKIGWITFCLIGSIFAVMLMRSPFGFTAVSLLFTVPIAIACRSRVMMIALAVYTIGSVLVIGELIVTPGLIGWLLFAIFGFFLSYTCAFFYKIVQEGTEARPEMGNLPGFGGLDVHFEIFRPGMIFLSAVIVSYAPYFIYCFFAYDVPFDDGTSQLGLPFVIMGFLSKLGLFLSGLLELNFIGWVLYILCTGYALLAIALVARLDTITALSPKLWLCSFFAVLVPFIGMSIFLVVANLLIKLGNEAIAPGPGAGFDSSMFVMFMLLWAFAFVNTCLAVTLFRCMGLLIGCNKQKIIQALKNAEA